jgi:hypothetical protein
MVQSPNGNRCEQRLGDEGAIAEADDVPGVDAANERSLVHHRRRCASYDVPILTAGRKHPEITWNLC